MSRRRLSVQECGVNVPLLFRRGKGPATSTKYASELKCVGGFNITDLAPPADLARPIAP